MSEQEERARVIAYAKTWIGTPFRDQGDERGVGADCAMSLIRWFADTGILAPFDPRPYPPRWHLHQDRERFLEWIQSVAVETGEIIPGNVAVYREGRCFAHGALIVDEQTLVHAWWMRREVVMSPIFDIKLTHYRDGKLRPRKIFDVWRRG